MPVMDTDRPRTRSEEKHDQIVEAAGKLFVESGYGPVSMDAIAAKANVSKRTVYSHFEDKASLFVAVMDYHCAAIGGQRILHDADGGRVMVPDDIAADLPDQSPRAVLTAFCGRFLKILISSESVRIFRVVLSEADRFPELARSFNEHGPKPLIRRLSGYLADQAQRGVLKLDDPERSAWQLISMVKEPWHLQLCLGTHPMPDDETVDHHVEATIDFFLRAAQFSDNP